MQVADGDAATLGLCAGSGALDRDQHHRLGATAQLQAGPALAQRGQRLGPALAQDAQGPQAANGVAGGTGQQVIQAQWWCVMVAVRRQRQGRQLHGTTLGQHVKDRAVLRPKEQAAQPQQERVARRVVAADGGKQTLHRRRQQRPARRG